MGDAFTINNIVLGFLFAGAAHGAVLLWLLGHPARNEMKRTLCIWEGIGLVWHIGMGVMLIFQLNPELGTFFGLNETVWTKGTHTFSLLTSLAVLAFIYALMGRTRGIGFRIWTVYITGLMLYLLLSPTAYADPKFIELMGAIGPLACYFFGIGLMIRTYRKSTDRPLRMRILCTTVGLGGAVFIFTIFGNILPEALGWDATSIKAYILIFNGGWISSFVMVAAVRYGIVSMQLDEIAEDLFTHVADPVVLIAPNGQISRVNPAAVQRFPSVFGDAALPPVDTFIEPHLVTSESCETKTLSTSEDRIFVCNLSEVRRGEEHLGNILHMRDVTGKKRWTE